MTRIGTGLLKETRASGEDSKSSIKKDILSLLVRANTKCRPEARMKDGDIIARAYKLVLNLCVCVCSICLAEIPTLLIAGYETRYRVICSSSHSAIKLKVLY